MLLPGVTTDSCALMRSVPGRSDAASTVPSPALQYHQSARSVSRSYQPVVSLVNRGCRGVEISIWANWSVMSRSSADPAITFVGLKLCGSQKSMHSSLGPLAANSARLTSNGPARSRENSAGGPPSN